MMKVALNALLDYVRENMEIAIELRKTVLEMKEEIVGFCKDLLGFLLGKRPS